MLASEKVEQWNFRSSILMMIRGEEESIANCYKLHELVKKDINFLRCRIIQTSEKNSNIGDQLGKQLELANAQMNQGINVSRDILINMLLASFAIEHGKGKFFEVIIALHPDIICLSKDKYGINIDTPLMRAIYNNNPSLVSTVLSNKHFIDHEFNNTVYHEAHVQNCQGIATMHFTEQPEILSMLDRVLLFRIPLISAMKTGDVANVSTILSSIDFIDHEYRNPLAHKSLLDACIECAKRWCSAQPKILEELQKANGIEEQPAECIMM